MVDRAGWRVSGPQPPEVLAAHEKYVSHIMFCRECFAPKKRHCLTGMSLRIEYDALFLMTISDIRWRRDVLIRETYQNPANADGLKARVIELFNEVNVKAQ